MSTDDTTPGEDILNPSPALVEQIMAGFDAARAEAESDRSEDVQVAVAELGSYAASMIVAAAHAEPMNKLAESLAELIHGSGRTGDTSRDNLSSTFSALAEAADDRLFTMIRDGATTAEIGGSYDRNIMYRRLARIRETMRELDAAVGAALGEFVPYAPEDAWPKGVALLTGDPDTVDAEAARQAEERASD